MSEYKKFVCEWWRCGWSGTPAEALSAPDPFNEGGTLYACPTCRDQTLIVACDEPGCTEIAGCGTPTPTGYRVTCGKHAPKDTDNEE